MGSITRLVEVRRVDASNGTAHCLDVMYRREVDMRALVPFGGATYRRLSPTERREAHQALTKAAPTPDPRLNRAAREWGLATSRAAGLVTVLVGLWGVYLALHFDIRAVSILAVTVVDVFSTTNLVKRYRTFCQLVGDATPRRAGA